VPGRDYLVGDRSMKANDIDWSNTGVMHECSRRITGFDLTQDLRDISHALRLRDKQ
jgi:hypothetical protein